MIVDRFEGAQSLEEEIVRLKERVEGLLDANNREVERRRSMEAKLDAIAYALEACEAYVRAKR